MSDDLQRRLRAMPGPDARLDLDAIVADARRRRRPKVAALSAAATAAGVLVVAPFVSPLLLPGSAPAGAPEGMQAPAPAEDAGGAEAEDLAAPCAAPALRAETAAIARFLDDPADGVASIEVVVPDGAAALDVLAVSTAAVDPSSGAVVAAPDAEVVRAASTGAIARAEPGTVVLDDVALAASPALVCPADGADVAGAPAPFVVGTQDGRPVAGVGEPWQAP